MSDIERFFTIWGGGVLPADGGDYVRYADHRAEVERLKNAIDHLTSERDEARAEVERLTARQSEMETHITGLTNELHRTRANGIELRWVEGEVEQLTAQRDAAQAEVERLTGERDEARAERDAWQSDRERLHDLLRCERGELSTLRDRLRVLQANPSASLTSSRPTDEDIWREAFMSQLHDRYWASSESADAALAEYRKRWPR